MKQDMRKLELMLVDQKKENRMETTYERISENRTVRIPSDR